MNHLPGPWTIEKSTIFGVEDQFGVAISSKQRTEFAFVYTRLSDEPDHSDVVDSPELMASAKLIAAAPDLLEALKEARELLHGDGIFGKISSESFNKINAAIKKATE